jgi:hypothetical protein
MEIARLGAAVYDTVLARLEWLRRVHAATDPGSEAWYA